MYPIVGGFKCKGFAELATKFLSSAMDSGFYIIRIRIYLLGKKNKKIDVTNFCVIVVRYIVIIRLTDSISISSASGTLYHSY